MHKSDNAKNNRIDPQTNPSVKGIWDGFRMAIPVMVALGIFGFVFGVLTQTKGLSTFEAVFMSGVVYAGAAQMVSVGMWTNTHLPTFLLVSTSFIICLRHILMGASIQPHFRGLSPWRVYPTLFFMMDESWALTMVQIQKNNQPPEYYSAYLFSSGFFLYLAWLISTWAGNILGALIADPNRYGFDFAFTAIFLALLIGLWRGKQDLLPWLIAAGVSILCAYFIPGNWYIILGALSGSLFGVWREYN